MTVGSRAMQAAGALVVLAGTAFAQSTPPPAADVPTSPPPLGPVQAGPQGELAQPAPRAGGAAVAPFPTRFAIRSNAPADPAAAGTERVFLDSRVTDVRVGDDLTVATMSQSPLSTCASNEYVFERDRAKWLFQTGRLLLAMREGAVVRISFTCHRGVQRINAIQFLSPPALAVAEGTPRPGDVVRVAPQPAAARPDAIPLPTTAGAEADQPLEERVRQIPTP